MAITNNSITSIIAQGLQNIQPGQYYPVNGAQFGAIQTQRVVETPMSEDPEHWGEEEQLKMFVWFMKMHHEEDIKGFKAMRDIERSVEREEQLERERQAWAREQQYYASQVQQQAAQAQAMQAQAQNVYNTVTPYGRVTALQEPDKESWWKKLLNKI